MSFVRKLLGRKDEEATPASQEDTETRDHSITGSDEPGAIEAHPEQVHQPSPNEAVQEENELTDLMADAGGRPTPQPPGLQVGYASDVGQLRDHNEDTLIAFQGAHLGDDASDPFGFFVVADGMGGHNAGEVASSLAARLLAHDVLRRVYLSFLLDEEPGGGMAPITEILGDAVQNANDQVHEQVPGGGTTLTCALILGQRAYIAHVGDSRAYLLTDLHLKQVTQDHSYVGRLMELGELSPEEAAVHPQRHVLYRAIGQGDNLDIDTYHQPLPPGSHLLLCSDGLSGLVSEEEIARIIAASTTPQEACQRLIDAANAAGGPDNITAVLIATPPN
jgi:serine/threonine protein phosphatase PrpC